MKNFLFQSRTLFFGISLITLLGGMGLYINFMHLIDKNNEAIRHIEIERAHRVSQTIVSKLHENTFYNLLQSYKTQDISDRISTLLSYYCNHEFKYVYILYKDAKGDYRYLADGSVESDRSNVNQKFIPTAPLLLQKALDEKEDVYDLVSNADGLWLTYLSPIMNKGVVESILVLDISTQEYEAFSNIVIPLSRSLNLFLVVLCGLFLVIIIQGGMFYKQVKRSMVDSLTKLHNRHYLNYLLSQRNIDTMIPLVIDIDHFKNVNDTYGHIAGDKVISYVARQMMFATRIGDHIIRFGGEEFLILLSDSKSDNDIIQIAERIRESIGNKPVRIDDTLNLTVTISIGINLSRKNIPLMESIKKADEMLYEAKENGRNRIEVFKD
ncbi:MAG: GGDEF domain-containing protein [Sulfurospirillaceae bacterium]|nr:GGDEF domain-containing protein [Sulfurospirillaceae bacterium]MDD2827002.1 GGDEF domain-containing protein [Sulfurospirillaceae bacterium]